MGNLPVWLSTLLLGLGTVFVGLICLIYITKLMSWVIGLIEGKKPAPEAQQAVKAAPAAGTIANRGAFVAAVASCIATVMGKDVSGLRIVSIKKVN